jgi:hypothetical protein
MTYAKIVEPKPTTLSQRMAVAQKELAEAIARARAISDQFEASESQRISRACRDIEMSVLVINCACDSVERRKEDLK